MSLAALITVVLGVIALDVLVAWLLLGGRMRGGEPGE
jgi:hypothetical protein